MMAVIVAGCSLPGPLKLRAVEIAREGSVFLEPDEIANGMNYAALVWGQRAGIPTQVLPPERMLETPAQPIDVYSSAFHTYTYRSEAFRRWNARGEITVFFVRYLGEGFPGHADPMYGVSWGIDWSKCIIVSSIAPRKTVAHEVGHILGLEHSWEDDLPPDCGPFDCSRDECRMNIMGYCVSDPDPSHPLWVLVLSEQQIATAVARTRRLALPTSLSEPIEGMPKWLK